MKISKKILSLVLTMAPNHTKSKTPQTKKVLLIQYLDSKNVISWQDNN